MQSINEIKEILSRCSIDALPAQLKQWEGDSRKGVQNVLTSFRKKYERHLQEQARLEEILTYERGCWAAGYALVAGIPVVTGEEGMCSGCGLATLSISYYDLGVKAAEMAYEILTNGADPAQMAIGYVTDGITEKYNADIAEALNITIPEDMVAIEN